MGDRMTPMQKHHIITCYPRIWYGSVFYFVSEDSVTKYPYGILYSNCLI